MVCYDYYDDTRGRLERDLTCYLHRGFVFDLYAPLISCHFLNSGTRLHPIIGHPLDSDYSFIPLEAQLA